MMDMKNIFGNYHLYCQMEIGKSDKFTYPLPGWALNIKSYNLLQILNLLQIIIEAEKGDGTSGYIAVDDLLFVKEESSSACTVFPPEAVVTPTEHPPTDGTTHIPPSKHLIKKI